MAAFSNAGLSWINHVATAASLSASSEVAGLPVANLKDDHRATKWRSIGAGAATLSFDLGASLSVGVVGLFGLNHEALNWRITLSNVAIGGTDVLDTGAVDADLKTGYQQTVHCPSTPLSARYGQITLTDASSPAVAYHQAGILWVGDLWRGLRNFSFGDAPAWADPSIESRARGGTKFFDIRDGFRTYDVDFRGVTRAEAFTKVMEIARIAGRHGNVLVVPTPGGEFQNYETILGTVVQPEPVPRWAHNLHSKRWKIEERL